MKVKELIAYLQKRDGELEVEVDLTAVGGDLAPIEAAMDIPDYGPPDKWTVSLVIGEPYSNK